MAERPDLRAFLEWSRSESNRRPPGCKASPHPPADASWRLLTSDSVCSAPVWARLRALALVHFCDSFQRWVRTSSSKAERRVYQVPPILAAGISSVCIIVRMVDGVVPHGGMVEWLTKVHCTATGTF